MEMLCVGCNSKNLKCVDDMLQVGYVAEIFKCNNCGGSIEVQYKTDRIHPDNIKNYKYVSTGVSYESSR